MTSKKPFCFICKHYIGFTDGKNWQSGYRCNAFEVIPKAILFAGTGHFQPLPNQANTIVFEPNEELKNRFRKTKTRYKWILPLSKL